jgi:hypothetical protein
MGKRAKSTGSQNRQSRTANRADGWILSLGNLRVRQYLKVVNVWMLSHLQTVGTAGNASMNIAKRLLSLPGRCNRLPHSLQSHRHRMRKHLPRTSLWYRSMDSEKVRALYSRIVISIEDDTIMIDEHTIQNSGIGQEVLHRRMPGHGLPCRKDSEVLWICVSSRWTRSLHGGCFQSVGGLVAAFQEPQDDLYGIQQI